MRVTTCYARRQGRCVICAAVALLFLSSAIASPPVGADTPVWISCSAPIDLATAAKCGQYAQTILNTTVHIRMLAYCTDRPEGEYWTFDSHATILDDHTLLTHNHYRILSDARCTPRLITFYTAGGSVITAIGDAMELAEITRQLQPQDGLCSMEACRLALPRPALTPPHDLRFVCPERAVMASLPEVAEINWNGKPGSTFVQWTRPVRLSARGDVPVLEMTSSILEGASGGGVYIPTGSGVTHIGTCWRKRVDAPGSVAALNPAGMGQ